MSVAGVDECAKGALLGPAVHCCFVGTSADMPPTVRRLTADSKKMTPAARSAVYDAVVARLPTTPTLVDGESDETLVFVIDERTAFALRVTCARTIDVGNLNDTFARATVLAIDAARRGSTLQELHLDRLGSSEEYHLRLLREQGLSSDAATTITSTPRAEDTYFQVALASVLGKVYRDRMLRAAFVRHGVAASHLSCTGYPRADTNVVAREFLRSRPTDHPLVRYKWSTVARLLSEVDDSDNDEPRKRATSTAPAPVRKRAARAAGDDAFV